MITTPGGIFASDSRYADIDGDGTLDLSIGRIPAETEEELLTYLARVRQIEAASASPSALFASDDPDAGVSFEAAANAIASIVREQDKQFVTLGQEPLATSRSRFMASWDLAPSFVHWTGHGGFDRLASEGLLTTADVASLSGNTSALVALTCIINRFELPAHTSLGEELLLSSAGGAGAVWAPTGLAAHDASSEAGTAFYQALARGFFRVGDAARFASSTTGDSSGLFVLLGDPALQIRLTGEASNPPTGTPE
jgi:hypothetical protein